MCGPLKPEYSPERLVSYIGEYFQKASSGHGYGHAVLSLPHLLIVHVPDGGGAPVMRTLGLETHMEWDSRAVEEIFLDTGAISAIPTKGR